MGEEENGSEEKGEIHIGQGEDPFRCTFAPREHAVHVMLLSLTRLPPFLTIYMEVVLTQPTWHHNMVPARLWRFI